MIQEPEPRTTAGIHRQSWEEEEEEEEEDDEEVSSWMELLRKEPLEGSQWRARGISTVINNPV